MRQHFEGIFEEKQGKKRLFLTESLNPGRKFFDEEVTVIEGKEFRVWDPRSSKLCSAILKGLSSSPFTKSSKVLYLGCAHGYTVSYLSEIVRSGAVFALDFAPRVFRDFMALSEARANIIPIIADANKPQSYYHYVPAVDVIFQDVAQPNQLEIFLKNCDLFLKKGGIGMLALKARSVDVTKSPNAIFSEVAKALKARMEVLQQISLEPFQQDHALFVVRK
ncbi:MAG: fibrillarin-like rRNA/tRNA 2'-O-methyltransferase [Candidatus Woesearchaeota archaeon]